MSLGDGDLATVSRARAFFIRVFHPRILDHRTKITAKSKIRRSPIARNADDKTSV
jgi:hypothetical protein